MIERLAVLGAVEKEARVRRDVDGACFSRRINDTHGLCSRNRTQGSES